MSLFQKIFSDKFANQAAVANNMLLRSMYRVAYPAAVLLNRFRISPDQITTLSLVSVVAAFAVLVLDGAAGWFCLFWGLAVLLDLCDGTVARMSARVATRAFRYDHMSDIFKISLVVVGVAIRFNEVLLWILCSAFLFVYLYSEIVSHDLKHTQDRTKTAATLVATAEDLSQIQPQEALRLRDRIPAICFLVNRLPFVYTLLQQLYVTTTTFNGHTLLVFLLLPIGGVVTYAAMSYLTLLALRGCVNDICMLWRMRR